MPSKRGRRVSQVGAWTEFFDEASGSPYFWNEATNETSWERPPFYTSSNGSGEGDGGETKDGAGSDGEDTRAVPSKRGRRMSQIGAWAEYWDEASGSPYFVNEATGESSWETPPGMAVQWS